MRRRSSPASLAAVALALAVARSASAAAVVEPPAPAGLDGLTLPTPTLLMDLDARVYPSTAEGLTGFALARMRPGLSYAPTPWATATAVLELAGESAEVLDAFVTLTPSPAWAITVGLAKPPLFPSHREPTHTLVFGDATAVAKSLRVNRDLGIGARFAPAAAPLEIAARIGDGSASFLGNDNADLAGYAAVDLVLGRAGGRAPESALGLRLGLAGLYEVASDRLGISAATPLGFTYYRPPIVSGERWVGEAHLVAYLRAITLLVEGGLASEARSKDDDGNPKTPRVALDPDRSAGLSGEVDATLFGRRVEGRVRGAGALDLGLRVERMWLGRGAAGVVCGGAVGASLTVKWWAADFMAVSLLGTVTGYDAPALEDPTRDTSWGLFARLSLFAGLK